MDGTPQTLPEALAALDAALAELAELRSRLVALQAERDTWRSRTGW